MALAESPWLAARCDATQFAFDNRTAFTAIVQIVRWMLAWTVSDALLGKIEPKPVT